METAVKIFTGIFLLILVFQLLFRGRETVQIINALFGQGRDIIWTLQGR